MKHGQAKDDDADHHDEIFNFCDAIVGNEKTLDAVKIHGSTPWCVV
jgi:hypothetical protein